MRITLQRCLLAILLAALICPCAYGQNKPVSPSAADDSNTRPPVTQVDLAIVQRARQLLDSPGKWNRLDNRECPAGAKTVSLYCALAVATKELTGSFEHRGAALQEARFVIDEITASRDYNHRLMDYNNDSTTTFADVQEVLRITESLISLRLKMNPASPQATKPQPSPAPSPSDIKPPITPADIEVAKRAIAILDTPAKWNRTDTQECPTVAKTFSPVLRPDTSAKRSEQSRRRDDAGGAPPNR